MPRASADDAPSFQFELEPGQTGKIGQIGLTVISAQSGLVLLSVFCKWQLDFSDNFALGRQRCSINRCLWRTWIWKKKRQSAAA